MVRISVYECMFFFLRKNTNTKNQGMIHAIKQVLREACVFSTWHRLKQNKKANNLLLGRRIKALSTPLLVCLWIWLYVLYWADFIKITEDVNPKASGMRFPVSSFSLPPPPPPTPVEKCNSPGPLKLKWILCLFVKKVIFFFREMNK